MDYEYLSPDDVFIASVERVKLTTMGNIKELQYLKHKNDKQTIKLLPGASQYIDLTTGEIKDCKKYNSRQDGIKNLRKTFSKLRALINTNITNISNVRWITLTYAENMQDTKLLYKDFEKFNKRFQYHCKINNFGKPEYIVVAEPQLRGAWHLHLLYIWNHVAPFIENSVLANIWGHGFVKITALTGDIDNIGAYLTAYLTDLEVDTSKCSNFDKLDNVKVVEVEGKTKAFAKGARLIFYPAKMNIYRTSRGIKQPCIEYLSYLEAQKKVSSVKLTFSTAIKIIDTDNNFDNIILKQYYK